MPGTGSKRLWSSSSAKPLSLSTCKAPIREALSGTSNQRSSKRKVEERDLDSNVHRPDAMHATMIKSLCRLPARA